MSDFASNSRNTAMSTVATSPPPSIVGSDGAPLDNPPPGTKAPMPSAAPSMVSQIRSPNPRNLSQLLEDAANGTTGPLMPGAHSTFSAPADLPRRSEQQQELFPEASDWADYAHEDVEKGLQRLAMLAKDKHAKDPSKTIVDYYSEALALLIKKGEIEFEGSYLARV